MPHTARLSNNVLGIELGGNRKVYGAGDTIMGRVYRKSPLVCPNARVKISLHGRAKSRLEESRGGNHKKTYRGRFQLINDRRHTQTIFEGPIHIAQLGDTQEWPFAITIPTHCEPDHARNEQPTFLPPNREAAPLEKLPPSFSGTSTGGSAEGFVEYYVEANLAYWSNKDCDNFTATLPFDLQSYLPDPPIADFQLKRQRFNRAVASQRLVPGMEDAELSTKDKMKKFFGTSSVPVMWFRLEVDYPTVIQLENPNPVPFRLRVVPTWQKTTEIIRNVPQKITLRNFTLKLRRQSNIKCEGTWSTHDDSFDNKVTMYLDGTLKRLKTPVEVPCTDEWPPIDVGEAINLRIGHRGNLSRPSVYSGERLSPDFTTWNIMVTHRMSWVVNLEIAGEEVEFRPQTEQPVVLMAQSDTRGEAFTAPLRSESWIQPPDEMEAPPSFAEVQREDKKAAQNNLTAVENGQSLSAENKG